jgi:hypothetical protein
MMRNILLLCQETHPQQKMDPISWTHMRSIIIASHVVQLGMHDNMLGPYFHRHTCDPISTPAEGIPQLITPESQTPHHDMCACPWNPNTTVYC